MVKWTDPYVEIDRECLKRHTNIDCADYPNEREVNGHTYRWISSPLNAKETSWRVDVATKHQGDWYGLHKDIGGAYIENSLGGKESLEEDCIHFITKDLEEKIFMQVNG